MSERPSCRCILCRLEEKLVRQLEANTTRENYTVLSAAAPCFASFPRPDLLLARLRAGRGDSATDEILRELSHWQSPFQDGLVQNLFVLAFLPLLHSVMRGAARRWPGVERDDTGQQALLILLQFLKSEELRRRESHIAFAIARKVKRRTQEWARRQTVVSAIPINGDAVSTVLWREDSFEREFLLHHFLNRATAKGNISTAELDLLVQIKLDGESGDAFCKQFGLSPNAFRQRLKRILTKLRRIARREATS
jgi:hypothetical protein